MTSISESKSRNRSIFLIPKLNLFLSSSQELNKLTAAKVRVINIKRETRLTESIQQKLDLFEIDSGHKNLDKLPVSYRLYSNIDHNHMKQVATHRKKQQSENSDKFQARFKLGVLASKIHHDSVQFGNHKVDHQSLELGMTKKSQNTLELPLCIDTKNQKGAQKISMSHGYGIYDRNITSPRIITEIITPKVGFRHSNPSSLSFKNQDIHDSIIIGDKKLNIERLSPIMKNSLSQNMRETNYNATIEDLFVSHHKGNNDTQLKDIVCQGFRPNHIKFRLPEIKKTPLETFFPSRDEINPIINVNQQEINFKMTVEKYLTYRNQFSKSIEITEERKSIQDRNLEAFNISLPPQPKLISSFEKKYPIEHMGKVEHISTIPSIQDTVPTPI